MTRSIRIVILALIAALTLVGCAPLIRIEQPVSTHRIPLEPQETVGQTFTADYRGLSGVALFLKPEVQGDGQLVLHLQEATTPGVGPELARTSLPLKRVEQAGYYRLDFPPLRDSTHHDYYLWLEIDGGSLSTTSGPGEVYLDGALYRNHVPEDGQLTFRLVYDRTQAILGLMTEGFHWLGILAIGLFLFLLPGWAVLSYCLPDWDQQWWAIKAGLSLGVSAAIYPLLFLWTDLIGVHLGVFYAWLPAIVGAIGLVWRNRKRYVRLEAFRLASHSIPADLAMAALLALLVFSRFWIARSLIVPLWGDSYQHTMITQLLVDHNGLFDNWLPYSPSQSFTYHFGFHTLSAVLHWLSNLPVGQATIWAGQLLNVFAVLSLVPLAVHIGHSRWAGVAAVFIAGLLLTLPQVYINWGRYTQLAGQVILPAAAYLGWVFLTNTRSSETGMKEIRNQKRLMIALGFVMGGLALTHYRVLVFGMMFFVAAYWIEFSRKTALRQAWQVLQAGLIGLILFLPWLVRLYSGALVKLLAAQVSTPASQIDAAIQEFNTIGNIFDFMPAWLWLLLFLACGWGLWRRERGAALVIIWFALNLVAANPQWLHLPGTGAIGSFTVMIAIYIPASILIGAAVGWFLASPLSEKTDRDLYQVGSRLRFRGASFILLVVTIAAGILSARQRLNDLKPFESSLFTRADQRAGAWIQSNLPQDTVFLVNSFLAYGGTLAVGSDGGWWLPLEARRRTTLPPINYATETGPRLDYTAWVNQVVSTVQQEGPDDPDSLRLLQEHNVTHVYIGQRQGSVNSPGPLFTPEQLLHSAHFEPLYHQDRVWIFRFLGP